MKCTLELYGTHESTEFSDRHAFGMIAAIGAGGMNLRSMFEEVLGSKALKESALAEAGMDSLFREFDMAQADKNLAYLLKKVFPTFSKSFDELSTADLITIVTPLIKSVVQAEAELIGQTEPLIDEDPVMPNPLKYPPELKTLTAAEQVAIDYAASQMNVDVALPDCWYQWWVAVNASESETDYKLTPAELIELVSDFSEESRFDYAFSARCYALLMANLEVNAIAA